MANPKFQVSRELARQSNEIKTLQKEMKGIIDNFSNLRLSIDKQIAKLNRSSDDKDCKLVLHENKIKHQGEQIKDQEKKIQEQSQKIQEQNFEIQQQNGKIEEQEREVEEQKRKVGEHQRTIGALYDQQLEHRDEVAVLKQYQNDMDGWLEFSGWNNDHAGFL